MIKIGVKDYFNHFY